MGCSTWNGQLSAAWSAVLVSAEVPALGSRLCYGWVLTLAGCSPLGTFSAGTSCEAHSASKSEVVVRAQISIDTVKMWLTIHMHITPSGPWPSLERCWQGKATVWQSTSCWRQLQRGEEALRSRSLLLEERILDKKLLTSLAKLLTQSLIFYSSHCFMQM